MNCMADDSRIQVATYRYPGRCYDADGELLGVGPWSMVLGAANQLAVETGGELPFQMPDGVRGVTIRMIRSRCTRKRW